MTPEQLLALARASKATVYVNRHYPLRPVVSFSHQAWLDFCNKVDQSAAKSQSLVTAVVDKPVAEVIISHVRPGLDGCCTAEVAGFERLPVGAELFIHPAKPSKSEPDWKQRLGNLLAMIHGDGGHYIDEHGWEKAQADAEEKIAKVMTDSAQSKPVAYRHLHEDGWEYYDAPTGSDCGGCQALYTRPQPRQPLTDEQITAATGANPGTPLWLVAVSFARAIERAHGIGGEA